MSSHWTCCSPPGRNRCGAEEETGCKGLHFYSQMDEMIIVMEVVVGVSRLVMDC